MPEIDKTGARTLRRVSRRSTRPTTGRHPPPTTNSKSFVTLSTRTRTGTSITRSFSMRSAPRASQGLPVPPPLKPPPSRVKTRQNCQEPRFGPRNGRNLVVRDSLRIPLFGHARLHAVLSVRKWGNNGRKLEHARARARVA
jgi:hypothetical protein